MTTSEAKMCGYDDKQLLDFPTLCYFNSKNENDTARQAMQESWKVPNDANEPLPQRCEGTPTDQPDVFTDGSLANPSTRYWRCGGFGINCPGLGEHSEWGNECDYTHAFYMNDGTAKWAAFSGGGNSSTRCELAAITMAIQRPYPTHIATDSKATLDRANRVIRHHERKKELERLKQTEGRKRLGGELSSLHFDKPWKKPTRFMKNGDLWDHLNEAIRQKGASAVRLTKVKAHATQEMVQQGLITHELRHGNTEADRAAERGSGEAQHQVKTLADLYASRHKSYMSMAERVQKFIIGMIKERKKLKDELDKSTDPFKNGSKDKIRIPSEILAGPDDCQRERVQIRNINEHDIKRFKDAKLLTATRNFLSWTSWGMPEVGQDFSWLELYTLFRIHSPKDKRADCWETSEAATKRSLSSKIGSFKRAVKYLSRNNCTLEHKTYFDPDKHHSNRLEPFAIKNKLAAIKGRPQVGNVDRKRIAKALIRARGVTDSRRADLHEADRLILKPVRLKMKAKANTVFEGIEATGADWTQIDSYDKHRKTPLRFVYCPNCTASRDLRDIKLTKISNSAKMHCKECDQTSTTRDWRCGCSHAWITCQIHELCDARRCRETGWSVSKRRLSRKTNHKLDEAIPSKLRTENVTLCRTRNVLDGEEKWRIPSDKCPKLAAKFPQLAIRRQASDDELVQCKRLKASVVQLSA